MKTRSNSISAVWEEISQAVVNKVECPERYDQFFIGSIDKIASVPVRNRKRSSNAANHARSYFYLGAPLGAVPLTRREVQVLYYICQGQTNLEVAQKINLSPRTIEYYIKNMRKKTKALNKRHLINQVLKSDFLERVQVEFSSGHS